MSQERGWMTGRAIGIVAEDKILAAQAAGHFDHMPGFGKPHPIFDEEYDPHWWIRRKLAHEGLTGPEQVRALRPDGS
ncbi:MAG TPA: DUF1992 domain-containing protein [Pirellulales bacterium]|nr:DUF1992 domain-containing protein [Pirellulales bacterium]